MNDLDLALRLLGENQLIIRSLQIQLQQKDNQIAELNKSIEELSKTEQFGNQSL